MKLYSTGYDCVVTNNNYVVFRGTEKECRQYIKEHKHEVEEDEEA